MDYGLVKLIHQTAVGLSIAGFCARGIASLAGAAWVRSRAAKTVPHVVDTVLLLSGVTLAWMLRLSPGAAPWLQAKLFGLVLYIVLGIAALRPGGPLALRVQLFVAALATVLWIVSVAVTKQTYGYLAALMP